MTTWSAHDDPSPSHTPQSSSDPLAQQNPPASSTLLLQHLHRKQYRLCKCIIRRKLAAYSALLLLHRDRALQGRNTITAWKKAKILTSIYDIVITPSVQGVSSESHHILQSHKCNMLCLITVFISILCGAHACLVFTARRDMTHNSML